MRKGQPLIILLVDVQATEHCNIHINSIYFVYSNLTYWRASVASETVLGVDNAKSGICYIYIYMYVCMDGTYAL